LIVNELIYSEADNDLRDLKAVQRIASALLKLLFPHVISIEDVNMEEFRSYCLEPAIHRRGIMKEQCHRIDPEFKEFMPEIRMK
jgi:ATP-dependent Lon protease